MLRRAWMLAVVLCGVGCVQAHHVVRDGSEYVGIDRVSDPSEWAAPTAPPAVAAPEGEAVAGRQTSAEDFVKALHSAMSSPEAAGVGGGGGAGQAAPKPTR